jgi:co-chaperonin GroES (HSP10)
MKAINYYIVIDKIKEAPKKVGGIELTEKQDSDMRYLKGKVISAGDKVTGIKEGDIKHNDKHAGFGIEWKDNFHVVITVKDVVIVE